MPITHLMPIQQPALAVEAHRWALTRLKKRKAHLHIVNSTTLMYNALDDDAYLRLERLKKSKPNAS